MASGIKIADDVKEKYQQICMTTSKSQKLKYAILKFTDDNKKIIVESCATAEEHNNDYDALISSLPCDDVRYICYDFEFINKDNCKKCEIILVSWHPDGSSVKKKMICASSFNALKACLGISKNILEGDTYSEVDSKAALEKVGGKSLPT